MNELYPSTITFLGYRFEVQAEERGGRRYIVYTALDPDTPFDVIAALHRTTSENIACMLKRFGEANCPLPDLGSSPRSNA